MTQGLVDKIEHLYNSDSKSFTCNKCKDVLGEHDCQGCPIYVWGHSGD